MKNKFEKTLNLWCCPYLNVSRNTDREGEAKEDGLVVAPAGRPDRPLRAGLAVASTHVGTRADTRSRHHAFRSVTATFSAVLVLHRRGRESITSGAFGRARGDIGGEEPGVRRPI